MKTAPRIGLAVITALALSPPAAADAPGFTEVPEERRVPAPVVPLTWRFPAPFSFESPLPEPLTMAIGSAVGVGDAGWGVAIPISFEFTYGQNATSDGYVAAGYNFPLLIHQPEGGDKALYAGNLKVDFRGVWKLKIGDYPGAWSAGLDFGIPTAPLWSPASDFGPQLGWTMFPWDPISWLSGYLGLAPKVSFAVGEPILFGEAQATIPVLIAVAPWNFINHELLGTWNVAAGTRPHERVTVTLEGGGVDSLMGRDWHGPTHKQVFKAHSFWAGAGVKVFYNYLDMGLMTVVPLGDPEKMGGSPKFDVMLTLGTTRRCCDTAGRGMW